MENLFFATKQRLAKPRMLQKQEKKIKTLGTFYTKKKTQIGEFDHSQIVDPNEELI
jgi:hypothetical protein